MEESKVKIVVIHSKCPFYKPGDAIYFDGPILNKEKSSTLCATAINAVYPFIYAARKGVFRETLIQCPDCDESVEFLIKEDI